MHPDLQVLVNKVTQQSSNRVAVMRSLSLPEQSAVFELLSPHIQQALLKDLKVHEIVDILDHMDLRRAESLVSRITNVRRRDRIVQQLKSGVKEKVEYFLRFHPKATVSLINFNYLLLPSTLTIGSTADAIDDHYRETGKFPEILVHEKGVLTGEVPMTALVRERNNQQLKKYIQPVVTISYSAEVADIMNALAASKKKKVVVLDHDESVLGIIYADEALALFGGMLDESLYNVTGVDDSERPFDGALTKFQRRYRWLIVNLVTCFLAGAVIHLFEDTLDALVFLSVYIPIVSGMGSNAGSQTFAVMLRGLTIGMISLKNGWPAISREMIAAVLNGLLIGGIVALVSLVWNGSWLLGLVVALSMIGVHLVAGFFGAFLPLFLKSIGKDPAAVTVVFLTTATDVFGLFFLFGLGTLLLT